MLEQKKPQIISLIFLSVFLLLSACSHHSLIRNQHSPLLKHLGGQDIQLNQAYQLTENAFTACIENQKKSTFDWSFPLTIGMSGVTLLNLSTLAILPFASHSWLQVEEEQIVFASSAAFFLASALIINTALTGGLAYTLWQEQMMQESLHDRLNHYRRETQEAYKEKDIKRLRSLSRYIFEDCRTITALPQSTLNTSIIRDFEKYRQDETSLNSDSNENSVK